jgi:hypothetical protein
MLLLEAHDVAPVPRLERDRTVGRRRPRSEFARLGDSAAGELGSGDAGGEAEVVLDPARGACLPAEHGAFDDECVESLRRAVYGRAESRWTTAYHQQVDLFARRELPADAERAQHLAGRRRAQLGATGEAHDGRIAVHGDLVLPCEGQPVAAEEVEHPHGRRGRARANDLQAQALHRLERLSPGDESGEDEVTQRPVVEQQLAHRVAVDGDEAQRLGDDRGDEDGLSREQVQLAEKPGRAVADDLLAGRVDDRDLALDDRDERVALIADAVEHVADIGRVLVTEFGQGRELRVRQHRAVRGCHRMSVLTHRIAAFGPTSLRPSPRHRAAGSRR